LAETKVRHSAAPELLKTLRAAASTERPDGFFNAAKELVYAEEELGMAFMQAVPNLRESVAKIQRIGEEEREKTERKIKSADDHLAKVNAEVAGLIKHGQELAKENHRLDGMVDQKKATLARAKEYENVQNILAKAGVKDPMAGAKMLAELEKEGVAKKVLRLLKEHGTLEDAVEDKAKKVSDLAGKESTLRASVSLLANQEKENKRRIEEGEGELDNLRLRLTTATEKLKDMTGETAAVKRELDATMSNIARVLNVGRTTEEIEKEMTKKRAAFEDFKVAIAAREKRMKEEVEEKRHEFDAAIPAREKKLVEELDEKKRAGLLRVKNDVEVERQEVSKELVSLRKQVAKLRSQTATMQEEVGNLDGDLGFLRTEKADLEKSISADEEKLVRIEQEVKNYVPLKNLVQVFVDPGKADTTTLLKILDSLLERTELNLDGQPAGARNSRWSISHHIRGLRGEIRRNLGAAS